MALSFHGWPATAFAFYRELEGDNTKTFWQAHKATYEQDVKAPFEALSELVAEEFGPLKVFRPNRDVRFSNDKRPYKQHFGCYVANGGRKSILPGYYVHFEPGSSFFGGGLYCPEAEILRKVRNEISVFPEDLSAILEKPDFKKTFGELWPDKLKSAPKGFPKDHLAIELIKYKSFTATCSLTDAECTAANLEHKLNQSIKTLRPFNEFLLRAIEAPEEEKIEF